MVTRGVLKSPLRQPHLQRSTVPTTDRPDKQPTVTKSPLRQPQPQRRPQRRTVPTAQPTATAPQPQPRRPLRRSPHEKQALWLALGAWCHSVKTHTVPANLRLLAHRPSVGTWLLSGARRHYVTKGTEKLSDSNNDRSESLEELRFPSRAITECLEEPITGHAFLGELELRALQPVSRGHCLRIHTWIEASAFAFDDE